MLEVVISFSCAILLYKYTAINDDDDSALIFVDWFVECTAGTAIVLARSKLTARTFVCIIACCVSDRNRKLAPNTLQSMAMTTAR